MLTDTCCLQLYILLMTEQFVLFNILTSLTSITPVCLAQWLSPGATTFMQVQVQSRSLINCVWTEPPESSVTVVNRNSS